jgi:hypothetical protein
MQQVVSAVRRDVAAQRPHTHCIERAKSMLAAPAPSVTDIGFTLGFAAAQAHSPQHFAGRPGYPRPPTIGP